MRSTFISLVIHAGIAYGSTAAPANEAAQPPERQARSRFYPGLLWWHRWAKVTASGGGAVTLRAGVGWGGPG
jgi:hypothetical protein